MPIPGFVSASEAAGAQASTPNAAPPPSQPQPSPTLLSTLISLEVEIINSLADQLHRLNEAGFDDTQPPSPPGGAENSGTPPTPVKNALNNIFTIREQVNCLTRRLNILF